MYGELASIKEVVDLTAEEAFEYAGTFLARLGYATLVRHGVSLTVKRDEPDRPKERRCLTCRGSLPSAGRRRLGKIRGNDQEGIREQQFEFAEWAEGLPKRGVVTTLSEGETREMTPALRHANGAEQAGSAYGTGPRLS